ncbi:lysophospholipid acyltransferase family protein [Paracoccaceae bacterium GXU_MW_L88]
MSVTWENPEGEVDFPPMGVMGWLNFLLRGAAIAVSLAIAFPLFFLVDLLGRPVQHDAHWIVKGWARLAVWLAGVKIVTKGAPMAAHGALVSNHVSWMDIWVLFATADVDLVSKAEVADWPGVGYMARRFGTVFIRRDPREAKRQEAQMREKLEKGRKLAFFPEGTSTDGLRVLPFRSTLFQVFMGHPEGSVQVQPVTLRYLPKPGLRRDFFGWWGEMDFGRHLKHALAHGHGSRVEVTFHTPLAPEAFDGRKALTAQAESAVRSEIVEA